MNKYIYKKKKSINARKILRLSGLGIAVIGLFFGLYVFYPLIAWQLFIKPVFANDFASPIPQATVLTKETIQNLLRISFDQSNWLPAYNKSQITADVISYTISIPELGIKNALVSTTDTDLSKHLVHFPGTALPPYKGTAVIFGHSTLPALFDPTNYKTIFARAHELRVGDTFTITTNNTTYFYKIFDISIVDAEDTSYLAQSKEDSYLTIVTCTPPGTIWKRLIIKASIQKI